MLLAQTRLSGMLDFDNGPASGTDFAFFLLTRETEGLQINKISRG